MVETTQGPVMAAVDLGSNTFQVLVARVNGAVVTELDRVKFKVGLAEATDASGRIDDAGMERGLLALEQLGARIHGFDPSRVRAVGTHALRRATNASDFLARARVALGFPVEVVSPEEEARLVYLGVTRRVGGTAGRRLVLDVGGGSTEIVLGEADLPTASVSYPMGCGSWTRAYLPGDRVTAEGMAAAEAAATKALDALPAIYTEAPATCFGGSGTIRSTQVLLRHHGFSEDGITTAALDRLIDALVGAGDPNLLWVEPVSRSRMPVLGGGLAILRALTRRLAIERITAVRGGVREGVVLDLVDRAQSSETSAQSAR